MNEEMIIKYIADNFAGTYTLTAADNTFFVYDPEGKFPFATLMINDANDQFSNLERPAVFRLNIGVSKSTFQSLFGSQPFSPETDNGNYDFTALDQIMPHPVYGQMYWVCVLNPSTTTFEAKVQPLLVEAYERDVKKYSKRINPE